MSSLQISVMLRQKDMHSLCSGAMYVSKPEVPNDHIAHAYSHKHINDVSEWACGFLCGLGQRPARLPPYGDIEAKLHVDRVLQDIYVACDWDIKQLCDNANHFRKKHSKVAYDRKLKGLTKVEPSNALFLLSNMRPQKVSSYCEVRIGRAISIEDVAGFFSLSGAELKCSDV